VHLLAFDPNAPAFVDDAWVRRSVVDLVRASRARQSLVALGGGDVGLNYGGFEAVRRLLDPIRITHQRRLGEEIGQPTGAVRR